MDPVAEIGNVGITIDIHVHHHFENALSILTAHSPRAQRARLLVGDEAMAQITVDTTNEVATVTFQDDKGNDTAAPDGTVATFASSDTSVLTVDNTVDNLVAALAPLAVGTADVSVTLADSAGNPLMEADGSPWPAVDSVSVEVDPGAAVGAKLSVS